MSRIFDRTHHRVSALLSVSVLLLTAPLAGQPGNAGPSPAFREIIDVQVVNIEVVITDGKQRVQGLGSEDFRLLVDGQEVPIEYFTEVRGSRAVEPGEHGEAPMVPALEPGTTVGTRYLVFIDDDFAIPPNRNRVLSRLADQVPLLGPDDHMAVVAFDGRQVEMLTNWTRSIPELETVFAAARKRRANGLLHRNVLRNPVFQHKSPSQGGGRETIGGQPERGDYTYHRVQRVVDAASSALRGFARASGRKVMLLLSGGWPVPDLSGDPGSRSAAEHKLFLPLLDVANRLGYTLYPADLRGVESVDGNVRYRTVEEVSMATAGAHLSDRVEEDALLHLARETGGRAFLDSGGLHVLEDTIDDVRSYYWLGFSPLWRQDDQRHRVKVEVRRKGLRVRSRHSISNLSRASQTTMMVESAQLFDLPLPASYSLDVTLGEPSLDGSKRVVVPLEIAIPMSFITLLPAGDGQFMAQLELRVAATDDRGDRAEIPVIPIELIGEGIPDEEGVWTYSDTVTLRRRPHRLLISIVDRASGEMLARRLDFDV